MIPEMLGAGVVIAAFLCLVSFGPETVATGDLPEEFETCQEIGLPGVELSLVVDASLLPTCSAPLTRLRTCGEVGGDVYRCAEGHAWRLVTRRWLGFTWTDLERWASEDRVEAVRAPAPWEVRA